MAQREKGKAAREKNQRVQAKKKRPIEKTTLSAEIRRQHKRYQRRLERKRRRGSVRRGLALLAIQLVSVMIFMFALFSLDMVPSSYLVVIASVLVVTIAITLATQLSGKGKRIVGKAFSVIISAVMVVGSFYILKGNTVFADVTSGGEYKTDNIVVAVLKSDSAKSISDAADYVFGVQYAKDSEHMAEAVQMISDETKHKVSTEELSSMPEQAQALIDGEVEAIVYNEGFSEIMNQAISGYEDKIKIIYTHSIQSDLQDLTIDVAVQSEPFNVFVSGIDVYGDISTNSRSDVNIIATVNPKTKQILLTTTPRDYYVEIPDVSQGRKDKLTHAGVYGVDVSMTTLEELYDIEIPFYARVNFTSLIEIIDILGGVDVDSDVEFTTSHAAGKVVEITKGMNHLNGEEALAFCRERKAFLEGDNQRGKDQQKVITAIIQKVISPTMIVKASSILDSVAHSVDTNMQTDQIKALIKQQLRDNSDWQIASVSAEGEGELNVCYSSGSQELYVTVPDEDSVEIIKEMIQKVMDGKMLEDSVTASGQ